MEEKSHIDSRPKWLLRTIAEGIKSNDPRIPEVLRRSGKLWPSGVPCEHPGCFFHISHPCEGCGRIGGRYPPQIDSEETDPKDREMQRLYEFCGGRCGEPLCVEWNREREAKFLSDREETIAQISRQASRLVRSWPDNTGIENHR